MPRVLAMSKMLKKPFRRLWSRVKGNVYLVKYDDRKSDPVSESWNRKQSCSGFQARSRLSSLNKTTLLVDDEKEHHHLPGTCHSKLEEEGSLDHLKDKLDYAESTSAFRNFSSYRKGSDGTDSQRIGNIVKISRNNQPVAQKYTHIDVKAMIAPILQRKNSTGMTQARICVISAVTEGSAHMSRYSFESNSTTASAEGSDLDNKSLDEESELEEESNDEDFDIDHYIDQLMKRENESQNESESDSEDLVSVNSENTLELADPIDEESDIEEFDIEHYINELIKRENESENGNESDPGSLVIVKSQNALEAADLMKEAKDLVSVNSENTFKPAHPIEEESGITASSKGSDLEDFDIDHYIDQLMKRENESQNESESDSEDLVSVNSENTLELADPIEEESDIEEFDIEHYINELIKRENESESDTESDSGGLDSVNSQNALEAPDQISTEVMETGYFDSNSTQTVSPDYEEDMAIAPSETSFADMELEKHTGPDLPKLMKRLEMVKYLKKESELTCLDRETTKNEASPQNVHFSLKEPEKVVEFNPASTLSGSKAEGLRWPISNFYIKEVKQEAEITQDKKMPVSSIEETSCSYKSIAVSASQASRKMKVMLGRVWCQEWWAKGDS